MMTVDKAERFARTWVQAWNDHDLETVLAHYSGDIVFHSPRIREVLAEDTDALSGKAELRRYWSVALQNAREIYFEMDRIYVGSDTVTLIYTNHRQQSVAETFVFGADGRIEESFSAYS